MKIRKSSSLVAAGCTMCIAAASGTVAPQAAAAAVLPESQPAVTTVSRDVALTASFDPLLLASLPLQNGIAIANALINVFPAGLLGPANTVFGQLTTGQVAQIPGTVQTGVQNEITAIANLLNLPAQIIQTDLAAIGLLANSATAGTVKSNALVANAQAAAAPDPTTILLGLASLPLQDAIAVANAFTSVFVTNFLSPANQVFGALTTGKVDTIPGIIQSAITTEQTAINNLLQLPSTLVQQNIAYLESLFTTTQASVNKTAELASAPTVQVAADPTTGLLTLISLPIQNAISLTNAAINVFPTGVVAPLNTIFAQLTTPGQASQIPATIQTAFTNELKAINTLLGLPATIVAQDIATIQKVFGTTSTLTSNSTLQKPAATKLSIESAASPKAIEAGPQAKLAADQQDQGKQQDDKKSGLDLSSYGKHAAERLGLTGTQTKTPSTENQDKTGADPADAKKDTTPATGDKDKTATTGDKDKKDSATGAEGGKKDATTGTQGGKKDPSGDKQSKKDSSGDKQGKDGSDKKTGPKHAKAGGE